MPQLWKERAETPGDGSRLIPPLLESASAAALDELQRQVLHATEAARRRAEDGNRTKLEWLRVVSHELRTPLNAIGGFAQLLTSGARGEVPAAMRADLDRIERNYLHMARLIDDVLHFARIEAGRIAFDVIPVPVARLLLDLHDYVHPKQRARGRVLTVRRFDRALRVMADEDKTRQVLLNLVTNAMRHTPPEATIEVRVHADPGADFVRVSVCDDGPGIPPDRRDTIFEPFVQVGRSLSRPAEGLGLGLTIARELARGMGGDLVLDPAPGPGATFTLLMRRATR